jgi:selenocysteine lyase/cysteine desulfurase
MEPAAVVERLLARRVIASVTPCRPPLARIATSLVNDHGDVEAALEAIRALA